MRPFETNNTEASKPNRSRPRRHNVWSMRLPVGLGLLVGLVLLAAPATAVDFEEKLTAADRDEGDLFGESVAVSGDVVVVGARGDDETGNGAGAAYVMTISDTTPGRQVKIVASDGAAGDLFGNSVAISGDTAIVGAFGDNDRGTSSGSAYIFVRSGSTWTEEAKLVASDGAPGDFFGRSVGISGDTAIVGAERDADRGASSGSAYVFTRTGTTWTQQAKLMASDGGAGDLFGRSVAASEDTLIVGAANDDDREVGAGSAYVFIRSGTTWSEQAKLVAGDAARWDQFGHSVAMSRGAAIVGSPHDDDGATSAGSAYVFTRSGTTWTQEAKLVANEPKFAGTFGWRVAVSGETAVVGSIGDDAKGRLSGSAYVFKRDGTAWTHQSTLVADDGASGDSLGRSVAISGHTAVAGAGGDDAMSGSAYVWNVGPPRGLVGQYFDDNDLSDPAFERIDRAPAFEWHLGSPGGLDPDTFSVRWTGQVIAPTTGLYTFHTHSDDASRVYVNDVLVLDAWARDPCCALVDSAAVPLEEGRPTNIRIEFAEDGGHAYNRVYWSGPDFSKRALTAASLSAAGLLGTYHRDATLTDPVLWRVEPVNHTWGAGAPNPLVGNDGFSVRWTGFVTAPETGAYTFYTRSDDGARVKVAGDVVLDDWQVHAADHDVPSSPVHLQAGVPTQIEVDYFEGSGGASMQLKWSAAGVPLQSVPADALAPAASLPTPRPTHIAAGTLHNCALFATGSIDCWGDNGRGQAADYTGLDALQVAAGFEHTCALLESGNVDCWGKGRFLQAIDYTIGNAIQVTAGKFHTCVLLVGGNVDCWGHNFAGKNADYSGGNAVQVTAGDDHTCALLHNGNIDCWGYNATGQSSDYNGGNAVYVSAGGTHTCAVLNNGNVDCWGSNHRGQALDYDGGKAVHVTTGFEHTCILTSDAVVGCVGDNRFGQTPSTQTPNVLQVAAGGSHTCYLPLLEEVVCVGSNNDGQLEPSFDWTPPQLGVPPTVTAESTGPTGAAVAYPLPESDEHITCAPSSGPTFPIGTTQIACTATDPWGNQAKAFFAVRVLPDTTPPTTAVAPSGTEGKNGWFVSPVTLVRDCSDSGWGCNTTRAQISDNNGATVTVEGTDLTLDQQGTIILSRYASNDLAGNEEPWNDDGRVFQIDYTAPVIAARPGETHEALGPDGIRVRYVAPEWTDNVAVGGTTPCAPASGTGFPLGDTTVTCTAEDPAGNQGQTTFVISVVDTIPPVVAAHADEVHEATGPGGAAVAYLPPTWTDLVDGSGTADCLPAPGALFPLGTTTVTCDATDAAGNAATKTTFIVSVEDTTPPAIEPRADEEHEATGPNGTTVIYSVPTWTDAVDGSGTASCTPLGNATFPLGNTTITCSAVDAAGNEASSSFVLSVVDTTPPAIEPRPDQEHEATGPDGAMATYDAPNWTDAVDGNGTAVCAPPTNTTFPLGNTTVTCSATDAAGNTGTGSFTIAVVDTTPPVVAAHANEVHEATGPDGANVSYAAPLWSDIVDGNGTADCTPGNGAGFSLGNTTVTCLATDAAGNVAATNFTVVVQDTTPPTIAAVADLTREATAFGGANVSYPAPLWTDIVDGTGPAICAPANGTFLPMGDTTITCTATDAAGNVANATTFKVTIVPGPVATVEVSPDNRTVNLAQPVVFSAAGFDRHGNPTSDAPVWAAENGTIDANGTYIASAVGMWVVNATMQNVTSGVVVHVTDQLRLDLQMDAPQYDPVSALGKGVWGTANLTFWDETPLPNATIEILVTRAPGGIDLDTAAVTVTSGADGTARFRVPDTYSVIGGYRVDAAVAWNGNTGQATTTYAVL